MTERSLLIRSTLLAILHLKQTGEKATIEQINDLFECGVITETSALRLIIKSEYDQTKRSSDISHRSLVIDISIRWNVSKNTIERLIYKTPAVKGISVSKK